MKNVYEVLRRPLITEKSTSLKETQRTLGFEVHRDATKPEIKKAVETLFGVKVQEVRVANVHGGGSTALWSPPPGQAPRKPMRCC